MKCHTVACGPIYRWLKVMTDKFRYSILFKDSVCCIINDVTTVSRIYWREENFGLFKISMNEANRKAGKTSDTYLTSFLPTDLKQCEFVLPYMLAGAFFYGQRNTLHLASNSQVFELMWSDLSLRWHTSHRSCPISLSTFVYCLRIKQGPDRP